MLDCVAQQVIVNVAKFVNMIDLWHQWLAHVNHRLPLQQAEISNLQLQGKLSFREACVKDKCHCLPHYSQKGIKSKGKLELVHYDVCGPKETQSFGGSLPKWQKKVFPVYQIFA